MDAWIHIAAWLRSLGTEWLVAALVPLLTGAAVTCSTLLPDGAGRPIGTDAGEPGEAGPIRPAAAPDRPGQTLLPFAARRFRLDPVARTALRAAAPGAACSGVTLELALHPELELRADPDAVRRALGELLHHAIAGAPGGKVLLAARRRGPRVLISVIDDGAGTPASAQAGRLRPCERLIGLQGGRFEIAATAGEGTTVTIDLPAAPAPDAETAPETRTAAVQAAVPAGPAPTVSAPVVADQAVAAAR